MGQGQPNAAQLSYSRLSFVVTGVFIYLFLKQLNVGLLGRMLGVFILASNINVLYLQSTAMTETLLLVTMTAGVYYLLLWYKNCEILNLILAAFWVMLASLIRYDGWFLLIVCILLIISYMVKKYGLKSQPLEGVLVLFSTLGGFGILLWFLWNLIIFKDPFYFVFGPYSAYAQQKLLEGAGNLETKGQMLLSAKFYIYALAYNSGALTTLLGFLGAILVWVDKKLTFDVKIAATALFAPLAFNILALYMGHSVLYVQGLSGNTWFNIRYGLMMMPSFAIFIGFLIHKLKDLRVALISLILFTTLFAFINNDAVTIDDAKVGASQKNVTQISNWLRDNAKDQKGFILISAASHDAIIFSSGLPMKRFIHEGTGQYWKNAITSPKHWARWIIMRTNDSTDFGFKALINNPDLADYRLIGKYPFADLYQLKDEYLNGLTIQ
ncbi:MAG: hypothetical protein M1365_07815 [Actinobacteria bacterium]|nr:hypothetical protein [Actinomycetota bacterium]